MPKRRGAIGGLLLAFVLIAAACGDDDAATTSAAPATAQTPATTQAPATTVAPEPAASTAAPAETTTSTEDNGAQVIDITLTSYEFSPGSTTLRSGEPVVVNVENLSSRKHTWTLLTAGTEWATTDEMDSEQILVTTAELGLNDIEALEFTAPEPGTYQVVCTIRSHIRLGMIAELIVEA